MFRRKKREDPEPSVDVADRLAAYEQLFNQAMAMAARFTDDRPNPASSLPAPRVTHRVS